MRATLLFLVIATATFGPWRNAARADGGMIRLMEQQGPYRLTVFTSPTPPQVGLLDVSVLVQDVATGDPISDGEVTITVAPAADSDQRTAKPATVGAATNKLFLAAQFELTQTGTWEVSVSVTAPRGTMNARFAVAVAEPSSFASDLPWWIGWPAIAVVLFAIHQFLMSRRPGLHSKS